MNIILGGGIGGLAAAYYLRAKWPLDAIKILEAGFTTGGWIKSTIRPNGTIFEQGPRTLRPKGEGGFNTLELVDKLGLSKKIKPIVASHPAAKKRMIYANDQLHILPSSLREFFSKQSLFSKPLYSYIFNDFVASPKLIQEKDESIYNFVQRRFGTEIAKYAISPMICGICAGDAKEISVKFLMKTLFENEQKYGSVVRGTLWDIFLHGLPIHAESSSSLVDVAKKEKWSIYSFDGGMEVLPRTLRDKLIEKKVEIEVESRCEKLTFNHDGVEIKIAGHSKPIHANHVISSISAPRLADLVDKDHPSLSAYLRKIPTVDVAVVNLRYQNCPQLEKAFGFLVPPSENLPILGVTFDSCCFPNKDDTVLTVMMGGHWFNKLFGKDPKEEYLLDTAIKQIKNTLDIRQKPIDHKVNILRNCIPQYIVGHYEILKNIESYISNTKLPLSICGSSYYGVGVNDVILSAKRAVDNL